MIIIVMGSKNWKHPILETSKNIVLPLQYYKIIKTVLINIFNLGNTKEITVGQTIKAIIKLYIENDLKYRKCIVKNRENLSYHHGCCRLEVV